MIHHATSAVTRAYNFKPQPSAYSAPKAANLTEERLPFTVRLVRNEADLNKAVEIRHAAYARHLPLFAETLKTAETDDAENGVVVFKAEIGAATPLVCQVQGVWVDPSMRGRGISVPAMAATVRLARTHIAPVVSLYVNDFNTVARRR